MSSRLDYVHRRLMELALIADTRELDQVEQEEEQQLSKELELLSKHTEE